MPYKTFIAGDEALASDVNTLLMSQSVSRFATAAARTAAGTGITAPAVNQLSMLDDRPGVIQRWTGSAWVDMPLMAERSVFLNPAVIVNAGTDFTLASFTMPWQGVVLINGMVRTDAGAGASAQIINCVIDGSGSSSPAWASPAQWLGPSQAANAYYNTIPFAFKTVSTPAGTGCTIKVLLKSNVPAMGYQVTWIQASIRLVPSEF